MAHAFPEELQEINREEYASPADVCRREVELIGWDHARIGRPVS